MTQHLWDGTLTSLHHLPRPKLFQDLQGPLAAHHCHGHGLVVERQLTLLDRGKDSSQTGPPAQVPSQ